MTKGKCPFMKVFCVRQRVWVTKPPETEKALVLETD